MEETLTRNDFHLAILLIGAWVGAFYLLAVLLPWSIDRYLDWRHKTNLVRREAARRQRCQRGRWN